MYGYRGENWFTLENTEGYTRAELDVLNVELANRIAGIDENSPEYIEEVKAFRDEVSRRNYSHIRR